ncbi:MAG: Gfo/Idh/MocA family oxidoreductase [Candidatus Sumerlaeota bacterium]
MRILGSTWQEGYLDYYRKPGELRVSVRAWVALDVVPSMFIERPRSLRLVWNYFREIGFSMTLQKIRSRRAEGLRNQRFFSMGVGTIEACDADGTWQNGQPVLFFAPSHPFCLERVVLDARLVRTDEDNLLERFSDSKNIYWGLSDEIQVDPGLMGWQPESGSDLSPELLDKHFDAARNVLKSLDSERLNLLPVDPSSTEPRTRTENPLSPNGDEKSACLFGLGNYAKTVILPNLTKDVRMFCVHESDPTQIGQEEQFPWPADTSPCLREDEKYDIVFIAGYHHTHADLAVETMERGGYAVVEKPVVTTGEQLDRLGDVLQRRPGRLFACFHMRYNPLLRDIWSYLSVEKGEAIHYYCTVYEIPLPERHWYRWPRSRSHIVSNGCHWLDHFLHLNDYSNPVKWDVIPCANGDSQMHVQLENGAVLGMHLTHAGSPRLGVRDHVEMRANGRTAVMESGSRYFVEDDLRVIRRKKGNRMDAYRRMYQTISERIVHGEPGDSLLSVVVTHRLALNLDAMRAEKVKNEKGTE